jgi:hypothetical protein
MGKRLCIHVRHCWLGADPGTAAVLCSAALSFCRLHFTLLKAPGEDEEGTGAHPFIEGETLSMAAHRASALTLSAGLGG